MLRKLPFKGKNNGSVFAVRIAPDRWGFVRFRDNTRFGVLPVYSRTPGLPKIHWAEDSEKWFACELSGSEKYETEDYVLVGEKPLPDPRAGFPDMYQAPQHPWQPWVVYRDNTVVHVNGPEDVVGMQVHRFMDAGEVKQLILEKFEAGELVEVGELATPCPTNPADKQRESEAPTIVFARIVQGIHPAERERLYEEPLAEFLEQHDLGEVTGGGTMQDKDGSVLFAGIDIEVHDVPRAIPLIARKLAELGAPHGSELEYEVDGEQVVHPIRKSGPGGSRRA